MTNWLANRSRMTKVGMLAVLSIAVCMAWLFLSDSERSKAIALFDSIQPEMSRQEIKTMMLGTNATNQSHDLANSSCNFGKYHVSVSFGRGHINREWKAVHKRVCELPNDGLFWNIAFHAYLYRGPVFGLEWHNLEWPE